MSAAAARTIARPPQAAPARLGPQTAPPKPRRQTNEHPVPARFASRAESEKFLVASKKAGMTYRAIRKAGGFTEAESTLRGRYRGLTKRVSERLRKPEWTDNDVSLFFLCLFFPLMGVFFQQTGVPSQVSGVPFSVTGLPSGGPGVLASIPGLPSRVWGVQVDSKGVVDVWSGVSASDPGVNDGLSRRVRTSRSRLSHLEEYPSPVPMTSLHPNGLCQPLPFRPLHQKTQHQHHSLHLSGLKAQSRCLPLHHPGPRRNVIMPFSVCHTLIHSEASKCSEVSDTQFGGPPRIEVPNALQFRIPWAFQRH